MNNKKRNTIITIVILCLMFISFGLYLLLNYSKDETSLSVVEKKWITDNANNVIDVNVYNDIPVYGYNGEGIIFNFLDYFTKETNINFNKMSYDSVGASKDGDISFLVINSNEEKTSDDILLYTDHYVVLSTNNEYKLNDSKIGILKTDSEVIKNYYKDSISILEYDDTTTLIAALTNGEINYLVLPNLSFMDDILANNLNIVYHLEDLKKQFVLRVKDKTIYNILNKSYNEYLESDYYKDFSTNYLNIYFKSTNTSDLLQKNYNAKRYYYGYTVNMPYENEVNDTFVGTMLNYIKLFEEYTNVEIEAVKYNTIDDLKSAFVSGDIDFALANFNYDTINASKVVTNSFKTLDYVVLSKNKYNINSLKGLNKEEVSVVASSMLYDELIENEVKTLNFKSTDDLLRNVSDYSIILMDKETYLYYKDSKLNDYNIILEDSINSGYKFILNETNEPFNSLFKYFVSTLNYQNIRYNYYTDVSLDKDYTSIKILAFIVSLIVILISTIIFMNKKSVTNTVITKDDMVKYMDPLTGLKNRNYLNLNIYKWDDNVIFPQSVIVLDVNKLREVNDTYGRETGDELIVKVAGVLINNQLENTDIVRSGGDEFLIYMVGYEEKNVTDYMKKLSKEMKDIPNSFGVEVGYSMILDEVKTVDDAINEAIIMMNKAKEKKRIKEMEDKN